GLCLPAGRTKATDAARRRRSLLNLHEARAFNALEHQLGNAFAPFNDKGGFAQVREQHLDLATVVAIDRAWTVEHGDAVPEGQSRAWPHLRLEARRQFQDEAGGDQGARTGRKPDRAAFGDGGEEVHAGGTVALVAGQIETATVR